jgi:hypothetical protein
MKNKEPDRLYVKKEYLADYKRLLDKDSPLRKKDAKNIFLMAMAIGFKKGMRIELGSKKEGYVRAEYLNNEEKTLIKSIAVHENKKLQILLDKNNAYSIAEEFSAGGIKLLKDLVFSQKGGSFIKKIESDLIEESENISKKKVE